MSMYFKNPERIKFLDEIRFNNGICKLKETFHDLVNKNPEEAVKLINDENVLFPSLFILQHEIKRSDLYNQLNVRNKYALEITNEMLLKEISKTQRFSYEHKQENYSTLKWILETGYIEDGLSDQYDEVLETAAIILTKVYKDKSCLRTIEEMIFNRYRKGAFIYDLVWAFFEASDPESLIMVVNRLRSSNRKDIELARRFLNFIPCIGMNGEEDPMKQYQCSLKWINENQNFIYYTGETFLQTSNPYRYAVSLEARYLQKTASNVRGELSRSLTADECTCMDSFMRLDDASKLLLSNCSAMLYRKSKYMWSQWLRNPIEKQIEIAQRTLGGSQ
ncbi:MAG TPA: hypothetical protein VIK78_17555 [Ruminiclostridium sp.]